MYKKFFAVFFDWRVTQNVTVYDFQSETQMLWEAQVETHYATLSAEEIYASYGLIDALNSADLSLETAQAYYEVASAFIPVMN